MGKGLYLLVCVKIQYIYVYVLDYEDFVKIITTSLYTSKSMI